MELLGGKSLLYKARTWSLYFKYYVSISKELVFSLFRMIEAGWEEGGWENKNKNMWNHMTSV